MTSLTPEQHFARYRDAGDLAALAAVFDAVAGQLLLVAGHLARDGALAEDLVQTTFVEAMRSAQHYDARRPLLPWLSQILTHHALKLQRWQRRHDRQRPLGARDERSAVEHVLDHEAMAAIQAGLARLSPTYQQVLTLRLVHDLPLAAIAHAIGCPPATVKTRLKRGLDQLRRHLPAGLATSLAVILASGRGLAAVRNDVLLRARDLAGKAAGAGTAAAFTFGGWLMMKQFLLWATVILVVLALGWWGVEVAGSTGATAGRPPDPAVAVAASVPAAQAGALLERQALADEVALPKGIVFVGRCVAADTRAPLAAVTAVVRIHVQGREEVCDNELAAAPPLARATSDANGAFRLQCERRPGAIYDVRVGNSEHVHRVRSFGPYEQDQVVELGDAALPRGAQVSLTVVDRRGAPVAGVRVTASRSPAVDRNEMLMLDSGWPWRSDAQGEIHLPYAMLPGRYEVAWLGDALPAERVMMHLEVPADREQRRAVLVWPVEDARHSIEGEVVDEEGRAISQLDLGAEGGGTRGNARTLANGTFRMARIGPYDPNERGPVEFGLPDPTCGFELVGKPVCNWGDRGVRLLARPAATLVVRARNATTGAAVEDIDVVCAARLDDAAAPKIVWGRNPPVPRSADGSVQRRLARRVHDVQVFPKDPQLAPSFKFQWDPRDGDEVVVSLTPLRSCTVLVVTTDGEPVVGTELWTLQPIEAVAGAPAAPGWREVAVPVAEGQRLDPTTRWARHGIDDAPLGTTRSGADGRAQILVPADADVVIAALGPGHVPKAIVGRVTGDGVELRVARGAALRLVLTPGDVAQRLAPSARQQRLLGGHSMDPGPGGCSLVVWQAESEQGSEGPTTSAVIPIAPDGTCEHHGLPPGRYHVALSGFVESDSFDGILVTRQFEPVSLREGEVNEIPLDVSCWAMGRLQGQILLNGHPWAFGPGMLWWLRWPKRTLVDVLTDAEGRFDVEVPVEGVYRLQLLGLDGSATTAYCFAAEDVQVAAGTSTHIVFTARNVTARARVVYADGKPAAGLTVATDYTTEPIHGDVAVRTDADGWITLEPAPPVPFHLIVSNPNGPLRAGRRSSSSGDATLGPFEIPPTGDRAEFHAVLPDNWR